MGFGLSSGGGGGGGHLEVSNFCCPEYLATMAALIKSNWNSQIGAAGRTHLRFVIQKDGRIADITVETIERRRSDGFVCAPRPDPDEAATVAGWLF